MANTKKTSSVKKASSVKKTTGVKKSSGVKKAASVKKAVGVKKASNVKKTSSVKKTAASVVRLGEPGKAIGQNAYKDCLDLVEVEIVDGVTEIGSGAFSGCVNLESIKIPKSVTRIGDEAFRGCSKLQNVVMAEGIEEIGGRAFAVCKKLKEIVIPASVKEIEDEAFVACVGLDRISFASGKTRIDEEAFKWCAVVRKVEVPVGLQEGCALLESRGYRAIKAVADRNAKYGDDVELRVARLELWSYFPTIGTAWVDSLDEVDDDLAECARDEGGDWGALDISDIDGELRIKGETVDIDFESVRRVEVGAVNTWSEFRDKIGIYSVDIDKAGCSTIFAIAGDFDPEKLTFYYKTAIGPGYYNHPEHVTIDLLDRVEYDGVELELDYGDERNNKGCMFTVFNEGKYAEYGYGCDAEDLDWKKFPSDSNWDWFGPSEWLTILSSQPQFADKCAKWDAFGEWEWPTILERQPQFADKCDKWDSFDAWTWAIILSRQPQFADKCDKWDSFGAEEWERILSRQPQFVDKCAKWDSFGAGTWETILCNQPQFADKCDKWPILGEGNWVRLLERQPQFADKCDKWERFDDIVIACLASEQGMFVPRLLQQKKLSPWAAAIILAKRPDVNVDTKLLSGKVDDEACERLREVIAEYDTPFAQKVDDEACERLLKGDSVYPFKTPWAYLLSQQPQFAGKFKEWKTLSVADWIGLLAKQPDFSLQCDWKKFEEEWDADWCPSSVTESDELIALIRVKTGIDIMEGMDFDAFVNTPALAKEFDSWDWGMSQAESWSIVLSLYPDLVAQFEADVEREDEGEESDSEED